MPLVAGPGVAPENASAAFVNRGSPISIRESMISLESARCKVSDVCKTLSFLKEM